ncbi:Sensor protein PhoQ [Halioglobus japonicus]|nr:Sensor protein PhoQ [Halioglobus japonicus]
MTSISRLLTVTVIGSLLLAGIAMALTANYLLDNTLRDYMVADLQGESRSLLKAIRRGPNGLMLDSAAIDPAYEQPLSGRYFLVTIDGQQWRSRSLWDEQLTPTDRAGLTEQLVDGPNEQRLLWLATDYQRLGESLEVLVGIDYSAILQDIRNIRIVLLISGIAALVLLALLQQLLVRRSMRPLEIARQQVEQLRNGSITALMEDVPEELTPLVREINRLLHDTQQQLHRSRVAVGDLSHALKTPLAVLRNLADRDTIRDDPTLHNALILQIEHIRQRITKEMARARTAGTHSAESLFDIETDLPLLLASVGGAHQQKIVIEEHIDLHGRIPWEREDILEILGNLLDNACKWGRESISLTIHKVADTLIIQIDDDGPGIPQDKLQQVIQRGERLDENVIGHGLGLAIVADKVEAYRGTLTFAKNDRGGLCVHIQLPWP